MRFFSRLNPASGMRDFWQEFSRPQPYRIPILLVSVALTGGLLLAFGTEKVDVPPEKPDIIYITTFAPDRTEAEIVASNIANQKKKDIIAAELARREEEKRDLYRTLGKMSGMDTDKIEAQAEKERAAEEKKREAYIEEVVGKGSDAPAQ
ncbi:hypothetical protein MKP08_00290 [Erythrobacter sp. LQ02-29]|uniref:hypothetical protein n=1 Tax=Erythrobacter sp. LQ02-29 TaxID=2920384 RepID=UPI001F4E0E42|nr:hypothetical protein [Erythrobacter sp. LQ02-29]MCP9221188.1 hypothetical protein [Erythrobacter sp. LQ02-29]